MHVPTGWMHDVYGNPHARSLLEVLGHKGILRYSEARAAVDLRPPEFQRALEKLERHGLIQYRAPAETGTSRQAVYIELSRLGLVAFALETRLDRQIERVFAEQQIPKEAAEALLKADGA